MKNVVTKGVLLMVLALAAAARASAESAPAPAAYVFRNVRIWDGRSDTAKSGEVLVVGNKIYAVAPRVAYPADVKPKEWRG